MDIGDFFDKNNLHPEMIVTKIQDHWVIGTYKDHAFEAKVYSEPSDYGIQNGCVSKLCILDKGLNPKDGWGVPKCVYNWDRGKDVSTKWRLGRELAKVFDKALIKTT